MKRLTLIGISMSLLLGFAIRTVKRGVKVEAAPAVANTSALPSFTISPRHGPYLDAEYFASSRLDTSADYYVYSAQLSGGSFTQTQVNSASNHHGCIACPGRSSLLDLFQLAIDPQSGKAAIIYVNDTMTLLPQAVLAQQN